MSVEAAFRKVAVEIVTPVDRAVEEFTLTTAELSYLQDRKVAMRIWPSAPASKA